MQASASWLDRLRSWLGEYLNRPIRGYAPPVTYSALQLAAVLQPGDVLLVEGNQRISSLIKYITQSAWSHVALYVGPQPGSASDDPPVLVEAELGEGVILSPLSKYASSHTRICRAIALRSPDRDRIVAHALGCIGQDYDFQTVLDLARERLADPSVAATFQRKLVALRSGEKARAVCSTLIAQAFQCVRYPILALRRKGPCRHASAPEGCTEETWEALHFSMYVPRDFDVSPYFTVVKPTLVDFDYTLVHWKD